MCLFPVLSPYFILRRLTRCILFEPYCWTWSQFQAVPCICFAILGCILYPLQYPSVFIWLHGTRSEGSSLTMEVGGVGSFYLNFNCNPTKLCYGGRSQFDLGRVYGSSTTTQSIKKRSLKRAHRRLQLNGCTWYRGQYWQQVTFPKPPDFIADLTTGSTTNHRCQPSEHLPSNRLAFWHWNSGTLSSTRYQELLRYLHLQKVDVALISETHWKYNIEWSTQHWHAIHTCSDLSCSSEKASGFLLLIAKRCCQAHQLSWRAIAPGRYPWHLLSSLEYLGGSTKSQAIYMGISPRHSSGISTEEYPMCFWWLQLLTSKHQQVGWYPELSNLEWSSVWTSTWWHGNLCLPTSRLSTYCLE